MPKRTDIRKIVIIGSGPIIISQACEFDYSGTQACKALQEEGYEVVLLNSNPATIMTDPEFAKSTYIEPITVESLEKIIQREKPDALLPTLGGQTGLNIAFQAARQGVFKKYGVQLIGADEKSIARAEDRLLFKETMLKAGIDVPASAVVRTIEEARKAVQKIGLPCCIRPAFTLGGTGGGIAFNSEEFEKLVSRGLSLSIISQVLIEESVFGWKEFEFEVMRDKNDNVVIICSIENFDPMGIHTGDSITVAPSQTLTDKYYQKMRSWSIKAIRAIGVETGGSNVQFAMDPKSGRMVIIEINPRVSRSSALASKATGFPIAKIAAKLAVGYTLDEIPNDITEKTPASFEPTIDYCVVKIPRFTFEKFPSVDNTLTTSMKSVGETMAIGRTFKEALQKGIRGLEIGKDGLASILFPTGVYPKTLSEEKREDLENKLRKPTAERLFYIGDALRAGLSVEEIAGITAIDPWFLDNLKEIIETEQQIVRKKKKLDPALLRTAKEQGFSDKAIARLTESTPEDALKRRIKEGVKPVYKLVDTCAAEFEAYTPYFYSTYEQEDENRVAKKKKVVILGGGPNRIGQGIEFDYCCVQASFALREEGIESIMVNSNPETVSTDYDTSDKLYFEPITLEDVLNIIDAQRPKGVILQFGGQTPLNLALGLQKYKVPILGTSADSIDRAEDRARFRKLLNKVGLLQPPSGIANNLDEVDKIVRTLGFPVLVRPSYVLGGRAMEIAHDHESLMRFAQTAFTVSSQGGVLIDKFLEDAIEVDVDLIGDGESFVIGGMLEHIEEAGVHSGDSAMCLPTFSLSKKMQETIRQATHALAKELKVKGLMNMQYAVKDEKLYVLEVNPRASRTIPFISKAIGVSLARVATKVMMGKTLKDVGFTKEIIPKYYCMKESVFPFNRFEGADIILGPEMKSTGEVMGIDYDFATAYLKSQIAAYQFLPKEGNVFISVRDGDKKKPIVDVASTLLKMGFRIIATEGTGNFLRKELKVTDNRVEIISKLSAGRPNILDYIKDRQMALIINTPSGRLPRKDEVQIRTEAFIRGLPCITTVAGALASVKAIEVLLTKEVTVKALQEYHKELQNHD